VSGWVPGLGVLPGLVPGVGLVAARVWVWRLGLGVLPGLVLGAVAVRVSVERLVSAYCQVRPVPSLLRQTVDPALRCP
jgi:hypothetical protein